MEGRESSESIAPRAESVSSISDKLRRYVSNILGEISIWVAEVLFSQGSDAHSGKLCRFIIVSPAFLKHALPELLGTERDLVAWKKNPIVRIRKESAEKIRRRDKQCRIELLSILSGAGYPQTLIQSHFYGVGRIVISKVSIHAEIIGSGLRDKEYKAEIRVKMYDPKESFFQQWMESSDNTKVSPEVNKDVKGV